MFFTTSLTNYLNRLRSAFGCTFMEVGLLQVIGSTGNRLGILGHLRYQLISKWFQSY